MEKSGKMWKDCQSAYSAILEECKNGTPKVLGNSSKDKYFELDNGLYVWDFGNGRLTIITKCNPLDYSKENPYDVKPAFFIRKVSELDKKRHGNHMFDFSIINDKKNKKLSEIKCSPDIEYYNLLLDSNGTSISSKGIEIDNVLKLLKDAAEQSTEDVFKDAYKKAAELYDLFIQKSKDKEKTTVDFGGNSKDIDSDSRLDMLDMNEQISKDIDSDSSSDVLDMNEQNDLENLSVKELEEMLRRQLNSNKLKSEELTELTKLRKTILIEEIRRAQQEGEKLDLQIREAKSQNNRNIGE